MHSQLGAAAVWPGVSARAGVVLVAVISRVVCAFLVSQWPRYFPTYHTSPLLLNVGVPALPDGTTSTTAVCSENFERRAWKSLQGTAARNFQWRYSRSSQGLPIHAKNPQSSGIQFQHFPQQPAPLVARKGRAVKVVPVFVPAREAGMRVLASAPLHDAHTQAFLSVSVTQDGDYQSIPVTARRPEAFLVAPDGYRERLDVACSINAWISNLPGAPTSPGEGMSTDRWLWALVTPLLSWDAEYFLACALQETRYYFEMTHAFFPGLGSTYLKLKEFIWPSPSSMRPRPPADLGEPLHVTTSRALSFAFPLTDATCYGLIGVILSNVAFVLATLGVFEVALLLITSESGDDSEAPTAQSSSGSNRAHGRTRCALEDERSSVVVARTTDVITQSEMASRSRALMAASFTPTGETLKKVGTAYGCLTASAEGGEGETIVASCDLAQNQRIPTVVASWAAFWYAFSGANVHMSAAYTESSFACLSVWGLVFLLSAECVNNNILTRGSPWRTLKDQGVDTRVRVPRGGIHRQPKSHGTPVTTQGSDAVCSDDMPGSNLTPNGVERTCSSQRLGAPILFRRYCFSWAATILFCSAALLRSNGSLSLIPLFFHTLRTCPGVRRVHAQSSFDPFTKKGGTKCDMCAASSVHGTSTACRKRLGVDFVKLLLAVFAHWLNALLQAFVVLLPLFVVLAYPYYLYCACPQLHSAGHERFRTDEQYYCQVVSRSVRQPSAVQLPPASLSPSRGAHMCGSVRSGGFSVRALSQPSTSDSAQAQLFPTPPSFFAFTRWFLHGGLQSLLQASLTGKKSSPADRPSFLPESCSIPPGRPIPGRSGLYNKFIKDARSSDATQYFPQSESCCFAATYTRPAWCANRIPNVYSAVQREYWGVEFLGFLRLETLYLIMLSFPFYVVSALCITLFVGRCWTSLKEGHATADDACIHLTAPPSRRWAETSQQEYSTSAKGKTRSLRGRLIPFLLNVETGHVVQLAVLSIVMLFFAHPNVFVRLSTACPVYFLHMARLHTRYAEAIKRAGEHRWSHQQIRALLILDNVQQERTRNLKRTHPRLGMLSAFASVSDVSQSPREYVEMLGAKWWEWCSTCVLVHHFLGPLLFGCYITWT